MGSTTGASLLRALLFASLFAGFAAHLAAGEKDCYDERDSVIRMCKWTIKKGSPYVIPDMPCRLEVRKVDMPCICRVLTAADERIISPEKLVRCSREAGVALPVGSKCGTYTIVAPAPPSAHA
ncbi:uncharacterized protein LOC125534031 [Triticum urartu]|uniref:Bifunctional inhibitor/plant lipid transfer protein/seed storage helical domain-containing protein n=2 Tax=Triticum TaxID=4564 RepID=A0A8R7PJU8_TRIUA|nr:uncharacterized protein LOC125530977 [Triticum urartu]XP_048553289.1 uncharacterized protein LOC125534024 [Triticum urartu]XP_048553296.1 uncharacterized protein LOC125534031 [Triticum urartu]VAH36390.1 unnamed protein product [Triticum turgidum subsp. durum]